MKAIGYTLAGNADVLREFSIEKPVPGPRDLLISVKAVSVNPVDYKIRASVTPEPGEMKVLGYDGAGIVEAVGADVTLFKPGDEVYYCGLHTRQGSNAEYQLVDERITGKKTVNPVLCGSRSTAADQFDSMGTPVRPSAAAVWSEIPTRHASGD